jgi:hypothetical protein
MPKSKARKTDVDENSLELRIERAVTTYKIALSTEKEISIRKAAKLESIIHWESVRRCLQGK